MKRRYAAALIALVFYAAVVVAVSSAPAETAYTAHFVRFLVIAASVYGFLSAVALLRCHRADAPLRDPASDLGGGIGIAAGFGVFYAAVLESGVGSPGATVAALFLATAATVGGFFAVLKL